MLSLCHLNIRSISKHFDEFSHWISLFNYDVICLTETWLNSSHFNSSFNLPGYILIRKDRIGPSRGGGLIIYIKASLKFERLETATCKGAEILSIRVIAPESEFCLFLVYNPPCTSSLIYEQFETLFEQKILTKRPTIITGDFNIDWSLESTLKEKFETLMSLNSFEQLVDKPTRCFKDSKTVIDLLFTNSRNLVKSHQVLNCDISDHFSVECCINIKKPKKTFSTMTRRDFRKFNAAEFFESAKIFNFDQITKSDCVHQAAESLEKKVCDLTDQFAPFKTQRLRSKRSICWKSHEVSLLMIEAKKAFQSFVDSGFDKNSESWVTYKSLRNRKNNAIRDAKKAAMAKILNDPSLSEWEKIKIFKGTNTEMENKIEELQFESTKYTDNFGIANSLNEYFSTIGLKLNEQASMSSFDNDTAVPFSEPCTLTDAKFSFSEVTSTEVSKVLNSLKARKTGGLSQIPAFVYQTLEPIILNPLTHIINLALRVNECPDVWKNALVIPIFKSGAKNQAGNYRPISLLPILSKVLEKIVSFQMREFLESNNLLSCRQFGFRSGTSTDQILLQLVNKIRHLLTLEQSKFVTLAALDIKKAFDCVNHNLLVNKLTHNFNFSQSSASFIENYLTNRSQTMKVNGILSTKREILTGVPQGSVLGPLLFIAFINNLTAFENCYLFADDCLMISSGKDPSVSTLNMENSIALASNWYTANKLVLNASKTDVMTISKSKGTKPPNLNFQGMAFKQSDKIKYLGVTLDKNLNFKPHVKKLKQKLYPIISNFERNRKFLNENLAAVWYTGLIRPNLEYCAPLLFCTNEYIKKDILKIENRCLKIINFNRSKAETRHIHKIYPVTKRYHYLYMLSFFKLIENLAPIIDQSLMPERLKTDTRLGKSEGLRLSKDKFSFALANFGAKLFNDLPPTIKQCHDLKYFKLAIKSHIFSD